MDPATEETSSLRLRELTGRLDYLEVEKRELYRAYKSLYERFLQKIESVLPILPSDASIHDCHEAVKRFCQRCPTMVEELIMLRQLMKRQKDEYCTTWHILDNEQTDTLTFPDWRKLQSHKSHVQVIEESFESESMGGMDYQVMQYYVHRLLKDQSEEARRFVLGKYNPFCTRLQARHKPQPEVSLGKHGRSVEVAHMIFSYCDLESCVALRQVSRQWYHSFQQFRSTLRNKLLERAPWFYNDGISWPDCVLIFVKRRRWDFSGQKKVDYVAPKKLVAIELQQGDTITSDFKALSFPTKPVKTTLSNSVIVLPPGTVIQHTKTFSHYILVVTYGGVFVFHGDNPLHHDHAIYCASQATGQYLEVGRFMFRKDPTGVQFLDFASKKLISYGPRKDWVPVAVYKGVVWMYSEGMVIPTFMDLQKGMFIVRKDKAMRVDSALFRQSINIPRMAVFGSCVIDFETGTVNDIETAYEPLNAQKKAIKRPKRDEPEFLMGYVGDVFHVYWTGC